MAEYEIVTATQGGSAYQTQGRNMAILSNGVWVAAYLKNNPEEVFVKYSSDEGETWSGEEQIDGADGYDKQHLGICAANDIVFCYWHDPNRQGIYGVKGTGYPISWGSVEMCADRSPNDSQPSAMIDTGGGVHLVWLAYNITGSDSNNSIGYKYRDPSTGWGSLEIVCFYSGQNQQYACVNVDSSGDIHVTWPGRGGSVTNSGVSNIYYKKKTIGVGWGAEEYLTDMAQSQGNPIVVCDSNDAPCVTWYGKGHSPYTSKNQVVYRDKDGGSWNSVAVISTSDNDNYTPSIGRNTDDTVVVAWYGLGYGSNPTKYNIKAKVKNPSDVWGSVLSVTDKANNQVMVDLLYHEHYTTGLPAAGFSCMYQDLVNFKVYNYKSDNFALPGVGGVGHKLFRLLNIYQKVRV